MIYRRDTSAHVSTVGVRREDGKVQKRRKDTSLMNEGKDTEVCELISWHLASRKAVTGCGSTAQRAPWPTEHAINCLASLIPLVAVVLASALDEFQLAAPTSTA
jgi:hypothetical protein